MEQTEKIFGSCQNMCPEEEINIRVKERLLHRLELLPGTEKEKLPRADPNKIVKCFSRSAADVNVSKPHLLRPFQVLLKTVQYLLFEVPCDNRVSLLTKYDYINDRLRAVRQDMTIQQFEPRECMVLLEPMVRFHVLFGYKLCEVTSKEYDAYLNKKHLLECLKQLLVCYDSLQSEQDGNQITRLSIKQKSVIIVNCRSLMETLYIICNLFDKEPLQRYLKLPERFRSDQSVKTAFQISLSLLRGNYVQAIRLVQLLSPLPLSAFLLHLPNIQRDALKVMATAYSSKVLKFPLTVLRNLLLFETNQDVIDTCQHYGLFVDNDGIRFLKQQFDIIKPVIQPKKLLIFNNKLDQSHEYYMTYATL